MQLEDKQEAGTSIPGEQAPLEAREPAHHEPAGGDDTEARARAMGWVSKEEYRGPADNWRDAGEFIKRGEEDLPVLRERLRDSTRRVADLERRSQAQEASYADNIRRLERMSALALERQRDQIVQSYRAAQHEAVRMADTERFTQLDRDMNAALTEHDKQAHQAVMPQQQARQQAPPDPVVEEWIGANTWFQRDATLNHVAQAIHVSLQREKPGLSLADNLRETARVVRERFPEKFSTGRSNGAPANVEGGSRLGGGQRARGVNELPAEAKRAGEKFVSQGLFKDMTAYAKDYWSEDNKG